MRSMFQNQLMLVYSCWCCFSREMGCVRISVLFFSSCQVGWLDGAQKFQFLLECSLSIFLSQTHTHTTMQWISRIVTRESESRQPTRKQENVDADRKARWLFYVLFIHILLVFTKCRIFRELSAVIRMGAYTTTSAAASYNFHDVYLSQQHNALSRALFSLSRYFYVALCVHFLFFWMLSQCVI